MFGFFMILLAIAVVEIVICKVVSNLVENGELLGKVIGYCFLIIAGIIMHEVAMLNMEFERYTWIGDLTEHEQIYYAARYAGLLYMGVGASGIIVMFFGKIAEIIDLLKKQVREEKNGEA